MLRSLVRGGAVGCGWRVGAWAGRGGARGVRGGASRLAARGERAGEALRQRGREGGRERERGEPRERRERVERSEVERAGGREGGREGELQTGGFEWGQAGSAQARAEAGREEGRAVLSGERGGREKERERERERGGEGRGGGEREKQQVTATHEESRVRAEQGRSAQGELGETRRAAYLSAVRPRQNGEPRHGGSGRDVGVAGVLAARSAPSDAPIAPIAPSSSVRKAPSHWRRSLTFAIRHSPSLASLSELVSASSAEMLREKQLEMLWYRVSHLLPPVRARRTGVVATLDAICAVSEEALGRCSPSAAAHVLHSLAHCRLEGRGPWTSLGESAQRRLLGGGCTCLLPDELARTAWALARRAAANGPPPTTLLDELAAEAAARSAELSGKDVAILAWSYAQLGAVGEGTAGGRLFDVLAPSVSTSAPGLAPFFLASALWAFERAGRLNSKLLEQASMAVQRAPASQFSSHDVAQIAWVYARAWKREAETRERQGAPPATPTVFPVLGGLVRECPSDFPPSTVAKLAWAFATVGDSSPDVFEALAVRTLGQLRNFNSLELSTLAWSFASAGRPAPLLFTELAARALNHGVDGFTTQGLAMTLYAFAKARHRSSPLFSAIAPVMQARLTEATPQAITMTLWAFTAAREPAPLLVDTALREATARMDQFRPREISTVSWAIGQQRRRGEAVKAFFDRLAELLIVRTRDSSLTPFEMAILSSALLRAADVTFPPRVGIRPAEVAALARAIRDGATGTDALHCEAGDAVAASALTRLGTMNGCEVARTAQTLALLGHGVGATYEALGRAAVTHIPHMLPGELTALAWAHAMSRSAARDLFTMVGEASAKKLNEFDASDLALLAWAFAAAGHDDPTLFAPAFASRCAALFDEQQNDSLSLRRLHQWHLWRCETRSPGLPSGLADRCLDEFRGSQARVACSADDVVETVANALVTLGLSPHKHVTVPEGYEVAVCVKLSGDRHTFAVDLTDPRGFLCGGGAPSGELELRWRHLRHFARLMVVPLNLATWSQVPEAKRTEFLRRWLDDAGSRELVPGS